VAGFKSISQEVRMEIAPFTVLASANSSGKSSIIQPLLLLKQTLEASFDPGPLYIAGPNVKFTSAEQLLSRANAPDEAGARRFAVGIQSDGILPIIASGNTLIRFIKKPDAPLAIEQMEVKDRKNTYVLREGMTHAEIVESNAVPPELKELWEGMSKDIDPTHQFKVRRDRCFLDVTIEDWQLHPFSKVLLGTYDYIRSLINVPGLRGNPERTYPIAAIGNTFPGTFEAYTASVIFHWQRSTADKDQQRLAQLNRDLKQLGLTTRITAQGINDIEVDLRVGEEQFSIADVGIGVSQVLPVLVALLVARPGQMVYVEQPEIHLHPRAQVALAGVLARAAQRGVKVVVETHSALLLLAIQTLVAEGKLAPDLVRMHWFTCADGVTQLATTDLGRAGAFDEDWPENFGSIEMKLQNRYLNAAQTIQSGGAYGNI
jgi:predicted ATPase